ncbi:hypothetical protein B0T18DRAFT_387862 [Schizothecium vesticola]|uniref:Uncharacterized protein n=1 Tax=Schizothecium vesticola TaxID=314040 RepID=A0AA40F5T0_9PEZI|nr:hypothetical protein B0T18DRAFT_387862 [Schizothecium vesticola]
MGGPTAQAAIAMLAVPTPSTVSPVSIVHVQPVVRYVQTITVGSTVALTTPWPEPSSCVSAVPTMVAGTCNTASCSAYPASQLSGLLYTSGLELNYPGFTTAQQLSSTSCMPPGFANIKSMYFTGGTQCPVAWTTATVDKNAYATSNTIVCCPTSYVATSFGGNAGWDCYRNLTLTAGQSVVLAAVGKISTQRPAELPTTAAWIDNWESRSIISTTAWPSATVADLFHPGVNFLVAAATATSGSDSTSSSSDTADSAFSLFRLGLGASVGILVAVAVAGLLGLCCFYALVRRCLHGPKRIPPPVAQAGPPVPYPGQGPPIGYVQGPPPPGAYVQSPPPVQYGNAHTPPPMQYANTPPPMQYVGGGQEQYPYQNPYPQQAAVGYGQGYGYGKPT